MQHLVSYCLSYVLKDNICEYSAEQGAYLTKCLFTFLNHVSFQKSQEVGTLTVPSSCNNVHSCSKYAKLLHFCWFQLPLEMVPKLTKGGKEKHSKKDRAMMIVCSLLLFCLNCICNLYNTVSQWSYQTHPFFVNCLKTNIQIKETADLQKTTNKYSI